MLRLAKVHIGPGGSLPVEYLTVSLAELLGQFRGCFARPESFAVFQPVVVAWILCLRCRTLTEVWQLTGLGPQMHFDAIYSLFASVKWDWDELGTLLCLRDSASEALVSCDAQGTCGTGHQARMMVVGCLS